ncbi:MAG: hypothetical protein R3Y15_06005 [Rikenellaceae bacterium]
MRKYLSLVLLTLFMVSIGMWSAAAFIDCYCEKIENCDVHYHCCNNGCDDGQEALIHEHTKGASCGDCCREMPMPDVSVLVDKAHKSPISEKINFGLDIFVVLNMSAIDGFEPLPEQDTYAHIKQEILKDQYLISSQSLRAPPVLS